MDKINVLVAVALCVVGCRQQGCDKGLEKRPSAGSLAEFASPLPDGSEPTATRIVIKNQTKKLAKLDVTSGKAGFVSVAPLDGSMGLASLDMPDEYCACRCDPSFLCDECEPPEHRLEELAHLEHYEVEWGGKLLRNRVEADGDHCGQSYSPSGLYLFKACTVDRQFCGVARVQLPTRMPVVLTLEKVMVSMDRCPLAEGMAERLSTYHLVRLELSGRMIERIAGCDPAEAICVDQHELPKTLDEATDDPCSMFVVPRRSEVESLLYLPRPEGQEGGERYSLLFDEHGIFIVLVKYDP